MSSSLIRLLEGGGLSKYKKQTSDGRGQVFRVPRLLINAMKDRKQNIIDCMLQLIRNADFRKTYRSFLADTEEGQRRIKIVYELILKALQGDLQPLVYDQSNTGYARATQGVPLENTLQIHSLFERAITNEFLNLYADMELDYRDLQKEIVMLGIVLDKAKEVVSKSYLKTREEIIKKRTEQIENLYKLLIAMKENINSDELSQLITNEVSKILGAPHVVLTLVGLAGDNKTSAMEYGSSSYACSLFRDTGMNKKIKQIAGIRLPHLVDYHGTKMYPISSEGIDIVPVGYWLVIPIFIGNTFYGILSIDTGTLKSPLVGTDAHVLFSVVLKIAQVVEKNETLRMLRKSQIELRRLANRIIQGQEDERKKISAEIHDTLIQRLTSIWYKLLYLEETAPLVRDTSKGDWDFLKDYVCESIKEARRIVYGLRPLILDELGLQRTIEEHVKTFQSRNAIRVDLFFEGNYSRLPPEKQVSLFRILQEALENVRKHSNSSQAYIELLFKSNGCSFLVENPDTRNTGQILKKKNDSPRSHFGLMVMKERAKAMGGKLETGYQKKGGFVVKGRIPYQ